MSPKPAYRVLRYTYLLFCAKASEASVFLLLLAAGRRPITPSGGLAFFTKNENRLHFGILLRGVAYAFGLLFFYPTFKKMQKSARAEPEKR